LWLLYLGLLALFALGTASFGTLQLESLRGGTDYQVVVHPANRPATEDDHERLPAGGRRRLVKPLPGWSPQTFKVRVVGLPEGTVKLLPWWRREERRVPLSFLRPVVLIGAKDDIIEKSRGKDEVAMTVLVSWKAKDGRDEQKGFELPANYRGGAVWIGCGPEDGVEVPKEALVWWLRSLAKPEVAALLLAPTPLEDLVAKEDKEKVKQLPADLTGAKVQAWLKRRGDVNERLAVSPPEWKVRHVWGPQEMVQLLPLEAPVK
jgi:hypothetical protein